LLRLSCCAKILATAGAEEGIEQHPGLQVCHEGQKAHYQRWQLDEDP
jgi:hypothetical protein